MTGSASDRRGGYDERWRNGHGRKTRGTREVARDAKAVTGEGRTRTWEAHRGRSGRTRKEKEAVG